jgi:hypothetical protein
LAGHGINPTSSYAGKLALIGTEFAVELLLTVERWGNTIRVLRSQGNWVESGVLTPVRNRAARCKVPQTFAML